MHLLQLLVAVIHRNLLRTLDGLQRFLRVVLKIHIDPSFRGVSTL